MFYLFISIYCSPAHQIIFASALTISGEHYKCNFPQHLVTSTIKSIVTVLPFCKNITIMYCWEFVAHFRVPGEWDVCTFISFVSLLRKHNFSIANYTTHSTVVTDLPVVMTTEQTCHLLFHICFS